MQINKNRDNERATMMKTLQRTNLLLLLLVVASCAARAQTKHNRLSTLEERARAVEYARRVEADPFSNDLHDDETWFRQWLDQISDVDAFTCSVNLAELVNAREPLGATAELIVGYSSLLLRAVIAARAAFVIEHPERAHDLLAICLAGLEGTLKTYQAIGEKYDAFHVTQVDKWLELKKKGELESYARSHAKRSCKN